MSRSRDKGTKFESRLVNWLRSHGVPSAARHPLHGVNDLGDIAGVDPWLVDAKNQRSLSVLSWFDNAAAHAEREGLVPAVVFPRSNCVMARAFVAVRGDHTSCFPLSWRWGTAANLPRLLDQAITDAERYGGDTFTPAVFLRRDVMVVEAGTWVRWLS